MADPRETNEVKSVKTNVETCILERRKNWFFTPDCADVITKLRKHLPGVHVAK